MKHQLRTMLLLYDLLFNKYCVSFLHYIYCIQNFLYIFCHDTDSRVSDGVLLGGLVIAQNSDDNRFTTEAQQSNYFNEIKYYVDSVTKSTFSADNNRFDLY